MFKRNPLDKHVSDLLDEYGLELVRIKEPNKGRLWTRMPEFKHYRVDLGTFDSKELEYVTALHEIGHAHCGIAINNKGHSSAGLYAMHVIEDEVKAWDWAFTKSVISIDYKIEQYREECLDTYYNAFIRPTLTETHPNP